MPLSKVESPGTYLGFVVVHEVGKSKSGYVEFAARCHLDTFITPHTYDETQLAGPAEITAYLYLTKSDGAGGVQLNLNQIESLEKAFGWSRKSGLKALAAMDLKTTRVAVVVKEEEAQNKEGEAAGTRMKVAWINRPGGLKGASPEVVDEMDVAWAAMVGGEAPKKEERAF